MHLPIVSLKHKKILKNKIKFDSVRKKSLVLYTNFKPMENKKTNTARRDFLKSATLASAGFMIVPRHILGGKGFTAPSDKLVVAGIGVGGKGKSDLKYFFQSGKAEIGYLCDVDDRMAKDSVAAYPKAKYYKDWRVNDGKRIEEFRCGFCFYP
jgi:hypothetical protein